MNGASYINEAIEKQLLDLNTCFLAKILSTDGKTAKIQPLGMIKQKGESAKAKAPLTGVPIAKSAANKFVGEELTFLSDISTGSISVSGKNVVARIDETKTKRTFFSMIPISAGDIVVCVCADRDITDAKQGKNSVPPVGHHSMSDAIIIGVL